MKWLFRIVSIGGGEFGNALVGHLRARASEVTRAGSRGCREAGGRKFFAFRHTATARCPNFRNLIVIHCSESRLALNSDNIGQ